MTKIIIVSTVGLIYDGITSVICSYLQAMDLTNLDIHIVATIKCEENICQVLSGLGCHIVNLPNRRTETFSYTVKLARYIRKNHIQVVHAHGNSGTLAIEMIAGWFGGARKRIAHSHNTRCNQIKVDKLLRPIFNVFYTNALACGEDAGRWLFGNRPFKVLPNGRDVEKFRFSKENRNKMRKKYNIKDNELTIGHVGGFFEQKNHIFLVQVFREIIKIDPTVKLFMIGDGPLKESIQQELTDIDVIFTGAIDNVYEYLSGMDGMLLPSLFEGLPLVVLEWQLNGLPCLISNTITKDCIFTDFVKMNSIDSGAIIWAKEILEMVRVANRIKNSNAAGSSIKNTSFDINDSAELLKQIYTT